MKKKLLSILITITIVLSVVYAWQKTRTSYTDDYRAFYQNITTKIQKNDVSAIHALHERLFLEIHNGNVEATQFFLNHNPELVNIIFDKLRPLEVALFAKKNNFELVKLLLSFKPEVNFESLKEDKMTLVQRIALFNELPNKLDILKAIYSSGTNLEYYTLSQHGQEDYSYRPPLVTAYSAKNKSIYDFLLLNSQNKNPSYVLSDGSKRSLLSMMGLSYLSFLQNKTHETIDIEYDKPLGDKNKQMLLSNDYQTFHKEMFPYAEALIKGGLSNDTFQLKPTFLVFVKLGNDDMVQLFLDNGICQSDKELCKKASISAKNNFWNNLEKKIKENIQ